MGFPTCFCRGTVEEYSKHVVSLSNKLLTALSTSLGLQSSERLEQAFGEMDMGMRINYYPPCPQPDLTLGLSSHSDPGGLTVLLQDDRVPGLQVKAQNKDWVTVQPLPGALVVNMGDQIQVSLVHYTTMDSLYSNDHALLIVACLTLL